jgi:glycosyltransferase involved in cell wall biosynthesis
MTHANVAAILANNIAGKPTRVVVSEHQTISSREQGSKERLVVKMASWLYPRAYRVVAVSDGLATELQNEFGLDTELVQPIPNPVHKPAEEDVQSIPHPWFERSEVVIVGAGRHEPQKDFSTLIRAIRILRADGSNAKLILLGDGSTTPELKQLAVNLDIEPAILFPGFVEDPYPYYRAADLFVLSSQWEGFGNVLVEAMAVGTPVVTTDCPVGPAEILADGKFGELAPVGDPESLANAIRNELGNPTDKKKLRERSKEFDPDQIAAMYKEVLF